jgi:YD repeat-containing protein
VQTNSHTLNDGAAIARTASTQWDAAACRVTQTTLEPGSATLQLTTSYGYDDFGNLSTETVSGVGVASRTTTVNWGASGRFPQTVTNALNQTTVNTWNAALAVPSSTSDPNGLATSWQYDAFGRRIAELRADQTSSHWTYANCAFGCDPRAKMQVLLEEKDANGQVIRSRTDFLDRWDRLLAQRSHLLTTSDTVWPIHREYDARGALIKDYAPFLDGGSNGYRKLT